MLGKYRCDLNKHTGFCNYGFFNLMGCAVEADFPHIQSNQSLNSKPAFIVLIPKFLKFIKIQLFLQITILSVEK